MKKNALITLALLSWSLGTLRADIHSALRNIQQALLWTEYLYVDSCSSDQLAENAIRGMLDKLDPHSTYLTADEVKAQDESLGGNFEGIGVMYQMERDTLLVINTVIGGPSEAVGILAGDQIVWVNDSTIAGMNYNTKEIQRRLRGPKGTRVKLGIKRDGERIDFVVERDKIPVYSIDASYMISNKVGYIKVSRFAATTPEEFSEALHELTHKGMNSLIIDLQGNGGGYLQSAVELASHFLHKGDLVVYTDGRAPGRKDNHVLQNGDFNGRVVVMIDETSASASEILSGALQDLDRAVVVGRRSFGKGLVQQPVNLPDGSMIRLTIAHYYTPSGRCIQKPYEKGKAADYRDDLNERYKSGELYSADSIHFDEKLKYQTRGGRTVYGGGGIMPDVFVPLDTTKICKPHRDLMAKGTLNRFVLDYFRENQKELRNTYKSADDFIEKFEVSDAMIEALCQKGMTEDSLSIDRDKLAKGLDFLKLQMKALIANDIYKQGAYNRVMNERFAMYRKAIEIASDEKEYDKILKTKK